MTDEKRLNILGDGMTEDGDHSERGSMVKCIYLSEDGRHCNSPYRERNISHLISASKIETVCKTPDYKSCRDYK